MDPNESPNSGLIGGGDRPRWVSPRRNSIPRKPIGIARFVEPDDMGGQTQRGHSNRYHSQWQQLPGDDSYQTDSIDYSQSKTPAMFFQREHVDHEMPGRRRHISLVCAFLVLPLLAITAALLIIIYKSLLEHDAQQCSGLIVDYGASQLTSLSTWISTIAAFLAPALMALLSYPIARVMTQYSSRGSDSLPSPYQTGLLIDLFGGSPLSLWTTLTYIVSKKRAKASALVIFAFAALFFALLLSILAQLADFWLHRATSSILHTSTEALDSALYGRKLSDFCENYYETGEDSRWECLETVRAPGDNVVIPCSVVCGNALFYPTGFAQGYFLTNSMSTNNSLVTSGPSQQNGSGLLNQTVVLLPANVDDNTTWTANSVGVSTQCDFAASKCSLSSVGSWSQFTCDGGLLPIGFNSSGEIYFNNTADYNDNDYWLSTLLKDQSDPSSQPGQLDNPWTFALAMNIEVYMRNRISAATGDGVRSDNNLFTILQCTSTTHNVEYTAEPQRANITSNNTSSTSGSSSSRSITINKLTQADQRVHRTIQEQILFASQNSAIYLQNAMIGAVFASTDGNETLRRFEEEFSRIALSFAASSFEGDDTISRQKIEDKVVSCVETAPLWSLVGLVCLYTVLAVVLTLVAWVASGDGNVRSAKAQLSVVGVVAEAFEGRKRGGVRKVEDLFDELHPAADGVQEGTERRTKRLGFRGAEGGMVYCVVDGEGGVR
jgi:hypothetical protein